MGYLNHKYLYQGYSMALDSLFQSARGPCRLERFACLRARLAMALFAPSFATAMRRSSVSATDRPPRRGLPRPNCHSHWLILYTLLPFLPDSSAASVSPCGNLAPLCWRTRSWCWMVGVELPGRKRGIKGTRPSTSATRPTYRMGVGEGSYSFCTPIAPIGPPPGRSMGL